MKPSELFCFKDTRNFEALYAYDANKSTRRLVEDRMNTKLTSTHTLVDSACSVSRVPSKTTHSQFCITS